VRKRFFFILEEKEKKKHNNKYIFITLKRARARQRRETKKDAASDPSSRRPSLGRADALATRPAPTAHLREREKPRRWFVPDEWKRVQKRSVFPRAQVAPGRGHDADSGENIHGVE